MRECDVCSRGGQETEATRFAVDIAYCAECAAQVEHYLRPGERLEDMTEAQIDARIYA